MFIKDPISWYRSNQLVSLRSTEKRQNNHIIYHAYPNNNVLCIAQKIPKRRHPRQPQFVHLTDPKAASFLSREQTQRPPQNYLPKSDSTIKKNGQTVAVLAFIYIFKVLLLLKYLS